MSEQLEEINTEAPQLQNHTQGVHLPFDGLFKLYPSQEAFPVISEVSSPSLAF